MILAQHEMRAAAQKSTSVERRVHRLRGRMRRRADSAADGRGIRGIGMAALLSPEYRQ